PPGVVERGRDSPGRRGAGLERTLWVLDLPLDDDSPSLRSCQPVSDLDGEHVGSEQLVNLVLELDSQAPCLVRVGLGQDPLQCDVAVQHVLHASSRASRIRSTAMFSTPCFLRISSVIFWASACTRAANSGSFLPVMMR